MYNIDIISDIHTYYITSNYKDLFWNNWVLQKTNDSKYLIIAWDINEDVTEIEKTLNNIIESTNYNKIIITFGNHDIWYRPHLNRNDEFLPYSNSIEKYNFLIEYFHEYKNKIHVIDKEDFIIVSKKIVITWNMWWYNYTIEKNSREHLENDFKINFDKMSYGTFSSNDKVHIKFSDEVVWNIDFADKLEKELTSRINLINKDMILKDYTKIAISHVKPSYLLEKNSPFYIEVDEKKRIEIIKSWEKLNTESIQKMYANAFYLNSNISNIYETNEVNIWIYWHTHQLYKKNINWIKYITNSYGYYLIEQNNPIISI